MFFDELNPFLDVTRTKFRRRPNTVLSFRRKFTLQIGMSARERDSASRGVRTTNPQWCPHVSFLRPTLPYHLRQLPFAHKAIRAELRSCFHQAMRCRHMTSSSAGSSREANTWIRNVTVIDEAGATSRNKLRPLDMTTVSLISTQAPLFLFVTSIENLPTASAMAQARFFRIQFCWPNAL